MADLITETTSKGWIARLMESIKGVLVGIVLFIVSFPVLWWNEGRAVQTYESLKEGAGAVVSVAVDKIDPANENKLIHVSGQAITEETLKDPQFNVSAKALGLRRQVEMYQWVQHEKSETKKKVGGGEETVTTYTYDREWNDGLVDSSSFKSPEGHQNPTAMSHSSESWRPEKATVGAFVLSKALLDEIDASEKITLTQEMLSTTGQALTPPAEAAAAPPPAKAFKGKKAKLAKGKMPMNKRPGARVAANVVAAAPKPTQPPYKVTDGQIYFGANPGAPQVGDTRISFSQVPFADVSIIAAQMKNSFAPYQTKAGNPLEMLRAGTMPAAAMFAAAQSENTMITWILRLVGFLLMAFGLAMFFRPLVVVADVLPFLGDFLRIGIGFLAISVALPLSLLTVAFAWLFYRPVLGVILLASGGLAFYLVKMMANKKKAAAPVAVPAPTAPSSAV